MTRTALIVAASVLALAACNKSSNPPSAATPAEQAATPDAHPAATIPTPANEAAAPDFVAKAAASDMFEIAAAKVALKRSHNADIKAFASMMIHDHTASTAAIKAAIKASGHALTPPDTLPSDLQGKLDDLNKASDADFDKTYVNQQADAHQAALDLMQRYAQDGDVAELKAAAAKIAPTVQQHLDRIKAIKDAIKA